MAHTHQLVLSLVSTTSSMDHTRNGVKINKTGALVWGQKRLQQVALKYNVVHSVLDMKSLDNNITN